MSGSEVVQIVSLILTAVVSIVTLLVRARIIALEGEIKELNAVVTAQNTLILAQGQTIDKLSNHIVEKAAEKPIKPIEKGWEASPPYRKA